MSANIFLWLKQPSSNLGPSFDSAVKAADDRFGTANLKVSDQILGCLRTNASVIALATHVAVKPNVPAVVAIEHLLFQAVGEPAFSDDMKQYTGWRVRQIVEELGGQWVRAGVRIRGSRYQTGSIYSAA